MTCDQLGALNCDVKTLCPTADLKVNWVFNLAGNVLPFAFTLTSGCKTPEVS